MEGVGGHFWHDAVLNANISGWLQYVVKPYAQRITDTSVLMTLARADNITSADLEVEAFNAIACPKKHFYSVKGVDHMSLYTNRDHLAKVGIVQSRWLKAILAE